LVEPQNSFDITQVVLSQIVLTEEKRGPQRLVDAGADAIHERGSALLDYVRKTLNVPADLVSEVEKRRGNLEGLVDEAIERTLQRLKLPTRRDLDRLDERIDKLSAQLKRSNGRAPKAAKAPRRRRAAR